MSNNFNQLLRILLVSTIGTGALRAVEERIPIAVASNKTESREINSWEEPALFPADSENSPASVAGTRRDKKASQTSAGGVNILEDEIPGSVEQGLESEFQTGRRTLGIESNGIGLLASRERDAALARVQSDSISQPYNIKIGGIPFSVGTSLDVDFTDNNERTSQNRESELTFLPRIGVSGTVKLASKTTLTIGLGVGYVKYLNKSENDRLLTLASLSPDTGVSLDIKIGKFLVSVYDRPGVPQFQADAATQRNQSQYSQFTNTAGLSVLWNINSKTNLSFRYNHTNLISLSSDENTTDGATDSFLASLSTKLSESLGVGIQGGVDTKTYEGDLLNNGTTYNIGIFADYELSRYLHVQGGFGYQGGNYDSGGRSGDSSSLGTYYANISIANNLNSRFSHSLSFGREAQSGAFSNFTVNNYIRYQTVWDVLHNVSLNAWASFEDIDESGGIFAEHFQYFSSGTSCSLRISSHISLSLTYVFTKRIASDSDKNQTGFLDFSENRVSLRIGYTF